LQPLQDELSAIKSRIAQEDLLKTREVLGREWSIFESEKNAAGTPKFPVDWNSEAGQKLASNIGSLVRGDTPLSQQFISNVQARIPGLTYQQLLMEAHRYYGGPVDDNAETPKTQATQKQINNSRRAASSKPGGSVASSSGGVVKKFKTIREAAEAAMATIAEREGH
jgi:hypothetical protein